MFTSEHGESKFLNDVQAAEKKNLAMNGLFTGINGTLTAANLFSMIGSGPMGFLSKLAIGIAGVATLVFGMRTMETVGKNDMQLMEMRFKHRKAMLDSMEVPTL